MTKFDKFSGLSRLVAAKIFSKIDPLKSNFKKQLILFFDLSPPPPRGTRGLGQLERNF